MKKEEIFVRIDNEEKRLRAIQILTDAGEDIWSASDLLNEFNRERMLYFNIDNWLLDAIGYDLTEITLDQLEQLLTPNYAVQEVHLTVDEIRLQAEKLGFELVEKKAGG